MAIYYIAHEGATLHSLTSENADAIPELNKMLLELSREKIGDFILWMVETNSVSGERTYTRIATANNGVAII